MGWHVKHSSARTGNAAERKSKIAASIMRMKKLYPVVPDIAKKKGR
jgi:hypothetical protein